MKRIEFIVKGKGVLTDLFERKTRKITRAVDSAIDSTSDAIELEEEKLDGFINALGVESKHENPDFQGVLRGYLDSCDKLKGLNEDLDNLKELKEKLNQEVDVTEEPEKDK